jgi:PDZ domain-containing secreted protein
LEGFFVWDIKRNSQFIGKIFLGDILKSVDGKRLNKLDHNQFMKHLKESTDKQKRRIYALRSKIAIMAKGGALGLSLSKVKEGFLVSDIDQDSQLVGKIFQDDILTSIDGTRLSELHDGSLLILIKKTFDKNQRRICIIRKR